MNAFFYFLFCLLITASSYVSAFEWESLAGCYRTIQYNSMPVAPSAENYSVINLDENPLYFVSDDHREFNVHTFILFKGTKSGYFYQDVFFENGQNLQQRNTLYNSFVGDVRSRFDEEKEYSIDAKTTVTYLNKERIEVQLKLSVTGFLSSYSERAKFILERKGCLSEEQVHSFYLKGLKLPHELGL